jgi:superfamily II DNA or RNA helicase
MDLGPDVEIEQRKIGVDWLTIDDSMLAILRQYQLQLVDGIRNAFRQVRRVLVQSATGSGKTVVIGATTEAAHKAGLRVLILATRTRLVRQIGDRLQAFHIPYGVIAAAMPDRRWNAAAVQVCSVDTLYRRAIVDKRMPMPPADVVIFDEAHLALGESRAAILDAYPDALILGFTATPAKISGRPLSARFDKLVKGPTFKELFANKALVPPRIFSSPVIAESELADITRDSKSGDYAVGELAAAMSKPRLLGGVLVNWLRIANGKRTLIFACNKAHGAALLEDFLRAGVTAEMLTDQTPEFEREAAITRLERGDTLILISCSLLSYGVDIPSVECIVLARPTRSLVLYLQAVGRGMRPAPGKEHVIVIDHGRVVESLGMPHGDFDWSLDAAKNVNKSARESTTRQRCNVAEKPRICPECAHLWAVSEEGPSCICCGWMPAPAPKVVEASDAQLEELGNTEQEMAADRFYCEALSFYRSRWPDRWAAKEKSARWWAWSQTRESLKITRERPPSWYWTAEPLLCTSDVAGKLKSRLIAFARARVGAPA